MNAPTNLHKAIEAARLLRFEIAKMIAGDDAEVSAADAQVLQDSFDGETTLEGELKPRSRLKMTT